MLASISGLYDFLRYFGSAACLVGLYVLIYCLATAHDEFELIRRNVVSAALAFGLSLLGFSLPLASAIAHSQSILDCIVWGLVALVIQVLVYWIVRLVIPRLSERIAGGEMAAALFLGTASLAAGVINAASMIY